MYYINKKDKMKISDKINVKKTLSFEVFPPKIDDNKLDSIYKTLDNLKKLNPDFVSVTYGAGGSNSKNTIQIASYIKEIGIEPLAHLTGGPSSPDQINKILIDLKSKGIDNILTLRGDKPIDFNDEYCKYFSHATDLIKYIKKQDNTFALAGACYPELHPESKNIEKEIQYLKLKENLGVEFFITQLFYDNNKFYDFVKQAKESGLKAKIIPGLMPLINPVSIKRIINMCKTSIPEYLQEKIEANKDDKQAIYEIGLNYCADQIVDLVSHDVSGIHLYIMNNHKLAFDLYERLKSVFEELF